VTGFYRMNAKCPYCGPTNSMKRMNGNEQPVIVTYSFRDTISLPMAVGLFLLQARLPGTICVTNSVNCR